MGEVGAGTNGIWDSELTLASTSAIGQTRSEKSTNTENKWKCFSRKRSYPASFSILTVSVPYIYTVRATRLPTRRAALWTHHPSTAFEAIFRSAKK